MGFISGIKAPKGRFPKSPQKRAKRRYLLSAAGEIKKALKRRYGSQGAASPVRRIDPATGKIIED
jgi:hypothetical protein